MTEKYLHDFAKNSAGGLSFAIDHWTQLERFLILGTQGGSYYASEQDLTKENVDAVKRCITEDGVRVVDIVKDISTKGRAPKNDPALFVLALCSASPDLKTRQAAFKALSDVARIGTHLFHFVDFMSSQRGWGRAARQAVAEWYNDKSVEHIAQQAVKYKERDGWSHRDLLRLAHPKTKDPSRKAVYNYIVKGEVDKEAPDVIKASHAATHEGLLSGDVCDLIDNFHLTREMIQTDYLNDPDIWRSLMKQMPMTAMIRNLGKMTSLGIINEFEDKIAGLLTDPEALRKARVHPLSVLTAYYTYQQGHGIKGSLSWSPNNNIVNSLEKGFYLAFPNHRGSGKRVMLALDVSGSMWGGHVAGSPMSPHQASGAMALLTAATEDNYMVTGFTSSGDNYWAAEDSGTHWGMGGLAQLPFVNPNTKLKRLLEQMRKLPMGGTDCALPMLYALQGGLEFDAFVVYTDSETWAGSVQPVDALQKYRDKTGIDAKLIVVGMVSNEFSIADPNDKGMLDVVGFDTATPQLISDFVRE